MKGHRYGIIYKCLECEFSFVRRGNYLNHLRNAHNHDSTQLWKFCNFVLDGCEIQIFLVAKNI